MTKRITIQGATGCYHEDAARVFVTPGFIFGSRGDRYIRISPCAPEEKMLEAPRRIESLKATTL